MSTVPLITVYHNATASQYHVSATSNVLQNADHSQRAAGCCRHSGVPPASRLSLSRGERWVPPLSRIWCDGWPASTNRTGDVGEGIRDTPRPPEQDRQLFFFIPLQQRKFGALDYTKGCIVIQQKVCFPSTVRNTMSRSRIPLLIPPLRLHSKWVLVLAVGRWC